YQQLKGFESAACEIEIVARPQLSILAFRVLFHRGTQQLDQLNRELLTRINASKRVYLTGTQLDGKFVIRICVLSFRTHLKRMQECFQIITDSIAEIHQALGDSAPETS
ncbi:MAG: hypothetical protein VX438_05045, partial [Planctomycetota bacterium]|nr:hypothetical protein [Planctomycetota bacterium]